MLKVMKITNNDIVKHVLIRYLRDKEKVAL
jgi:hypothetical protein